MTKDEALKMAIDDLELCNGAQTVEDIIIYTHESIKACKEALEQPAQEPVYIVKQNGNCTMQLKSKDWVGLSDDDITKAVLEIPATFPSIFGIARAIEQALRNKNASNA